MSDHNYFQECIAVERSIWSMKPQAERQIACWNSEDFQLLKEIIPKPGSDIVVTAKALSLIAKALDETIFASFNDTPLIVPPNDPVEDILVDYDANRRRLQDS